MSEVNIAAIVGSPGEAREVSIDAIVGTPGEDREVNVDAIVGTAEQVTDDLCLILIPPPPRAVDEAELERRSNNDYS